MTEPSRDGPDLVGAGLILLAATCFATLGPLSRYADQASVSSLALVFWRAMLGAGLMAAFLIARRATVGGGTVSLAWLPSRDLAFVAAAAVANTILNLAVFVAFLRVSIALALLVFYLYPALVALVSLAWFGERLDGLRWGALGLSMVGTVLVVAGAGDLGALDPIGIGLAFVGAVGQTFYVLAARHGFARVPGAQAAALTMGGAAALYLVVALAIGAAAQLTVPLSGGAALWPVLVAGLVGAGIPTVCYITGIRRLGAPRAAILANFEPVVAVLLAAVLLAEQPTPLQLLGGVLIIASGVVLQLRAEPEPSEHGAYAA
ncbi:MAG TPA: DMT family transporter [Candidatus Limnocylindria bacterium]|nr:DMT family transporter [Candidatus Limnocylindria bacterium]